MRVLLLSVFLIGLAAGAVCNPETPKKAEPGPVIAQLKARDHTILIRSAKPAPLYEIRSADGKVVAPAMTLTQLQAKHPEYYQRVRALQAKPGQRLWAGR